MRPRLDRSRRARRRASAKPISRAALGRLAAWWDKYATSSVSGVKRVVGKEIEVSTNLVAGALSAWHKAGAAAGDVKFWRLFVDQFDSPKAFQLVVEALLERGDRVASMALMLQWVSQVEYTPLEDGDASFHPLALRWLRTVEDYEDATRRRPMAARREVPPTPGSQRRDLLASARIRADQRSSDDWISTTKTIRVDEDLADDDRCEDGRRRRIGEDAESWQDDEPEELYGAAYEDMVYRDSTDDGFDADIIDECTDGTEFELEEEAQRLGQRLEFLSTDRPALAANRHRLEMDADDDPSATSCSKTGANRPCRATKNCSSWPKPSTTIRFRSPAARTNRWSNSTASGWSRIRCSNTSSPRASKPSAPAG